MTLRIFVSWTRQIPDLPGQYNEYSHWYEDQERAAADVAELLAMPDIVALSVTCNPETHPAYRPLPEAPKGNPGNA